MWSPDGGVCAARDDEGVVGAHTVDVTAREKPTSDIE